MRQTKAGRSFKESCQTPSVPHPGTAERLLPSPVVTATYQLRPLLAISPDLTLVQS